MRSIYRLSYPTIVVTALLTSCSRSGDASKDFAANKELFHAIAKADSLVLYEGLPHQDFEAQLLEQEMRNKQSVTLHGFPFYRETLEVPAEDRDTLKAMLGSESFFRPWRGEKKCGGFHPDYLTEWRHGEEIYQVLVCFGCFEVKVFGAGKSLWCDVGYEEYGKLKSLLTKYRKNRPPQEN